MSTPSMIDLDSLYSEAASYENEGSISSLSNLEGHNVYLYSGAEDRTVDKGRASPKCLLENIQNSAV